MWTKKSYDALYLWVEGNPNLAAQIMLKDGLTKEVETLQSMPNLGVWYQMTLIASKAVGPQVVEQSAHEAEAELDRICQPKP
jgi:hypothetical protein